MYSNRGQTTLQTNKRNLHDLKTTSRLSGSVSSLPAVIFTLCHFLIVSLKGEYSLRRGMGRSASVPVNWQLTVTHVASYGVS